MNVIFDMDGVIFDSERAYVDAYKKLAEKYGLGNVEQACIDSIGVTRELTKKIFFEHVGYEFDYDKYREEVQQELNRTSFALKPGVYEIFGWLSEIGARVALASSTRREHVYPMLDGADLTKYFQAIVCGDMVGHSKPNPEIFLTAADKLGAKPEDCYIIEDSYNGIRAAHAAAAHPIMVPDIVQPDDEINGLAEIVLPSLLDVKEYLATR